MYPSANTSRWTSSERLLPTPCSFECGEEPFYASFSGMKVTAGLRQLTHYVESHNYKPAPHGSSFIVHCVRNCKPEAVAVRIPRRNENPYMNRELFREVELLKTLEHPGIIKPLAMFHTPGIGWIEVLPAYDCDLEIYCQNNRYHPRLLVDLSRQTLSAFQYLHGKGFIHADVKQQNTLVKMTEGGMKFVLCDFGLADKCGYSDVYSSVYHPPELSKFWCQHWREHKDVDGKLFGHRLICNGRYRPEVDIWMYGLMMFRTFYSFTFKSDTVMKQLGTLWAKLQEHGPVNYASQLVCEQKVYQNSVGRDHDSYCRVFGEDDMAKLGAVMTATLRCLAIDLKERPSTECLLELYHRL